MNLLSIDIVSHTTSFLVSYEEINPDLAFTYGSMSLASKLWRKAVELNATDFVRNCTSERWVKFPNGLLNVVVTDALRLNISGVTQRMALALGVPKVQLDDLNYEETMVTRWLSAHSYSLRDIISTLSHLYPVYTTPTTAKSNARPKKRGW